MLIAVLLALMLSISLSISISLRASFLSPVALRLVIILGLFKVSDQCGRILGVGEFDRRRGDVFDKESDLKKSYVKVDKHSP